MNAGPHSKPDWGLRFCFAALATGGFLARSRNGIIWPVLFGIPVGLTVIVWIARSVYRDHGKRLPVSGVALRSACLLLTVLGLPAWLWYAFGPGYYREFNLVKARLEAIPGVTLIESGGNPDITFESITAVVRVKDRGDLSLWGLTDKSFSSAQSQALAGIGQYRFHWTQCGYHGVYRSSDRTPVRSLAGGFSLALRGHEIYAGKQLIGTLPVSIRTVQDVVTHYDVVHAWVEGRQGRVFAMDHPEGKMTWRIWVHRPAFRELGGSSPAPRPPAPDTCR